MLGTEPSEVHRADWGNSTMGGYLPLWISIWFVMSALSPHDTRAGEVMERIRDRGYVNLVGVPDWPPFSSIAENGEYAGFDVDVGDEIARRMGVRANRQSMVLTWQQETGGDWNGKIDMSIGSMTPTAKRGANLDFPAIYYYGIASLAVHRDNRTIRAPADASNKRVGALKSSTYELYLRRIPFDIQGMLPVVYKIDDPIIVTYEESEGKAFEALAKGDGVELDAIVNFLPTLMSIIKGGMPFRIIGQPLYRTPQAVAIKPGDPELADTLKRVIGEMREDGTLMKLSMKWFDFDMTKP